jgi:hypothetical protein
MSFFLTKPYFNSLSFSKRKRGDLQPQFQPQGIAHDWSEPIFCPFPLLYQHALPSRYTFIPIAFVII